MEQLRVDVYDTTLRDGTQREGISLSVADKLRILTRLDALGVAFVEAGWPGASPKDAELFARARDLPREHAALAAFGATCRAGVPAGEDAQVRTLVASGAEVCTIFGKSSRLHVEEVLRTTLDENLRMIEDTVAFLVKSGRRVVYDAEHFFDGFRDDPRYAEDTLRAAARAGAEALVLCDTNGGSLPWQVEEAVRAVLPIGKVLGIHAHDDTGCAVANSLTAVRAGARHVQGTINGYGERCGNANLSVLIPDLVLKLGARVLSGDVGLRGLTELSRFVAEVANLPPDEHMPYVGRSAFAHKGGVHVAAVRRNARAYEHVDPAHVGNKTRVVLSELAGRATVLEKAAEHGVDLGDDARAAELVLRVKEEEAAGASFEAAEASIALLLRRAAPGYVPPFKLLEYRVMVGHRAGVQPQAECTIKLDVHGAIVHTAAEGNGPVSALDAALRKALAPTYPTVATMQLVDYKVRILDGRDGTSATTRVLLDSAQGDRRWTTVGAGTNVLEASWLALADSLEYGLNDAARC